MRISHRRRKFGRKVFGGFVVDLPVVVVNVSLVVDGQTGELEIGFSYPPFGGDRNSGRRIPGLRLTGRRSRHLVVGGGANGRMGRRFGLGRRYQRNRFAPRRRREGGGRRRFRCSGESAQTDRHSDAFRWRGRPSIDERLVGSGRRQSGRASAVDPQRSGRNAGRIGSACDGAAADDDGRAFAGRREQKAVLLAQRFLPDLRLWNLSDDDLIDVLVRRQIVLDGLGHFFDGLQKPFLLLDQFRCRSKVGLADCSVHDGSRWQVSSSRLRR